MVNLRSLSFSFHVALRFSRNRQNKGFLSFISAASTLGIMIGAMALIAVLSVMNGFERELKDRLLSVVPHAELISVAGGSIDDWREQIAILQAHPQVIAASPLIKLNAIAQKGKNLKALEIRAIDPQQERLVSGIAEYIDESQWSVLNQDSNTIVLGEGVLEKLRLEIGDNINLLIPQLSVNQKLKPPKSVRFKIAGSFSIGGQLDYGLGYISLAQGRKLTGMSEGVQGIRLKLEDVFSSRQVIRELGMKFPHHVAMHDWTISHGHLYHDIVLVKAVMYLVLTLVIAVASFNIVSTLVMTVQDKRQEIAILKTMGANNAQIVNSFIIQGLFNGMLGTLLGVVGGVALVFVLPNLFEFSQQLLNTEFLQQDVYFINFLPVQLESTDVIVTALVAVVLSVISTIYPAIRASKIQPTRVLGH